MSLRVSFQMDPMDKIRPATDSTFALMLEAQRRGYEIFHYEPGALALEGSVLKAKIHPVTVRDDPQDYYSFGEPQIVDLSTMDIIFLRQDPPFDMAYITTTYLLETIKDRVLIMNDPTSVRDCSEKLFALTHFPDLMPPTLVSRDIEAIEAFREKHGDVILKPLYGHASAGINYLTKDNKELNHILKKFNQDHKAPPIVQKFLSGVRQGDKRITLFDGKPVGALNRIPPENDIRAALALGGKAEKTSLTPKEKEICDTIGSELKARGLIFAGIDVIEGYLTEINVTSPTGLRQTNALDDTVLEKILWDILDKKLKELKSRN